MKGEFVVSALAHLLLCVILFTGGTSRPLIVARPQPIQVRLVSLPPEPPEAVAEAKPIKKPPVKETKGITFAEIKKPKKKAEKKAAAKVEEPKPQPQVSPSQTGSRFGEAVVDAPDFAYSYYVDLILNKIYDGWANPVSSDFALSVVIYFKILRGGQLADVKVEAPSGIAAFDRAAYRAVVNAGPLPPLPAEYEGTELGIHLEFQQ